MSRRPLTHEERLELITRSFFINNLGTSYPWGGVAVVDRWSQLTVGRQDGEDDELGLEGVSYGGLGVQYATRPAGKDNAAAGSGTRTMNTVLGIPDIDFRDYIGQRPPGRIRE